jgi:hypothetical protein
MIWVASAEFLALETYFLQFGYFLQFYSGYAKQFFFLQNTKINYFDPKIKNKKKIPFGVNI